jgi:hypothetical protein
MNPRIRGLISELQPVDCARVTGNPEVIVRPSD